MSVHIRRIDPYGWTHPMIPVAVIGGIVLGAAGVVSGKNAVMVVGGVLVAFGVLAATKATISAVLGALGLLSGLVSLVFVPGLQTADMSAGGKALAVAIFTLIYMILMDAVVLAVAVLYNFFGAIFGGVTVDLEETA